MFISISFSLLTCLYTKYIFSFQGTLYISVLVVDLGGLEPPASRLSGVRSNLLSYRSIKLIVQDLIFLRKEVIQPLVLERLPCYDFTPVIGFALGNLLSDQLWAPPTSVV